MPGLFELVSSKTDGAVVRSLTDGTTRFASTRQHNFSHLESIEVYTIRENVNLADVFKAMQAASASLPDEKDAKAIKAYFEKVFPDLDFERVYASDMKKMVKWYTIISSKGIEIKLSNQEEEAAEVAETPVEETPAEAAPAKPSRRKKKED